MHILRRGIILFVLLVLASAVFVFRDAIGVQLRGLRFWSSGFFSRGDLVKRIDFLTQENVRLRNEVKSAERGIAPETRYRGIQAFVYSYYPWNGRRSVMVDRGSEEGVRDNLPVLTNSGLLFGKVVRTWRTQSEVMTVFDSSWKSSVGIGGLGVKAVLQGGAVPIIDLIPARASVGAAQEVINIGPEFPLFTPIGSITAVSQGTGSSFQQASIELGFNFESVEVVRILTDFP